MKKKITLLLVITLMQASCQDKKNKDMTHFTYSIEVSAPEDYPADVHYGVLSNGDNFISPIPKAGTADGGWGFGSGNAGMKASGIPNHLELTWISYAEKKFWKIDTALPQDKIDSLVHEGFNYFNRKDVEQHETYDEFLIGLAPGGVVIIWIVGSVKKIEIGRFQAQEIYVNKLDFEPVKDPSESQELFLDTMFKISVPKTAQVNILQNGIPFGLWDEYRVLYNWKYHTISFKGGEEEFITYETRDYVNGESSVNDGNRKAIVNEFDVKPVPWRSNFTYKDYSSSAEFDKEELMNAFKTLSNKHPNKPIEIVINIKFMYKGLTFKVKCEGDEIPLEKVKVVMYKN